MTCDKYSGFMPLKRAILLWYKSSTKKNEWKIMYRPNKDDYKSKSTFFETDFHKFTSKSSYWQYSYGCCNIEWEKMSPFQAFTTLIDIFFKYQLDQDDERYNINEVEFKEFLYELGKIQEFEEVRLLRYKLFIDDNFEYFEEYEKETWSYEYCHPVLH